MNQLFGLQHRRGRFFRYKRRTVPLLQCGIATPCPCQKHPFTKMHVLYFLNTRSGCPGNFGELSLYLNPLIHSPRRTIHSGFVFLDPIAAMFLCRCSAESLSIMAQQLPQAQIRKQVFPDE